MLRFLAIGTYICWVAILTLLILYVLKPKILQYISKHALKMSFGLTIIATIGSLYLSEVLLIVPCPLCWYQRVLTYSQMMILGIAVYLNDPAIKRYLIPINILGLLVSGYHILIQTINTESFLCTVGGGCSNAHYTLGVSVPIMSFTIYASVLVLLVIAKR